MGMYDNIKVPCPKCGEEQWVQSKGGECVMETYDYKSVPEDVASDANRHAPFECECGAKFKFADRIVSLDVALDIEAL